MEIVDWPRPSFTASGRMAELVCLDLVHQRLVTRSRRRWEHPGIEAAKAQSQEFGDGLAVQVIKIACGCSACGPRLLASEPAPRGSRSSSAAANAFIQFLDHAVGVPGPVAHQRHIAGNMVVIRLRPLSWASFTQISVAPAARAPSMAATASRVIISRNSGPIGMGLIGLVPMGYASHALNIDTDIDFHFR